MKKRILGIILILFSLFIFTSEKFNNIYASSTNENSCTIDDFIQNSNKIINAYPYEWEEKIISFDSLTKKGANYYISNDDFSKLSGDEITKIDNSKFKLVRDEFSFEYDLKTEELTSKNQSVIIDNISNNNEEFLVSFTQLSESLGYSCVELDDGFLIEKPYISKRLILKSSSNIDSLNSIAHISGYANLHIIQFSSEIDTINALNYYDSLECVDWVCTDKEFSISEISENESIEALSNTYNTWGAKFIGVDEYLASGVTFKNSVVAVIDTGIDTDHSMLSGRIDLTRGKNFTEEVSNTSYNFEDLHGHGTHVAGTITELTPSNIQILPLKVLKKDGKGSLSHIVLAMEYCNELKSKDNLNIVAMNMSLGGTGIVGSAEYVSMKSEIDEALSNGIVSVVAAGNSSENAINELPANVESAITISAVAENGEGQVAFDSSYSNYGSVIDLCAPGTYIVSAGLGGGTAIKSGTSMATPHVASMVALLSSSSSNYSVDNVIDIIISNADDLGTSGKDNYYGYGLVNLSGLYTYINDKVSFSNTNDSPTSSFYLELDFPNDNANIYYTINGSIPTISNGKKYNAPISVVVDTIVKARAIYTINGITYQSYVETKGYSFNTPVEGEVEFSNKVTNIVTDFNLSLTYEGDNVQIYYTLDGSTPSINNGTLFVSPIIVDRTLTVKAIAYDFSGTSIVRKSKISSITYVYNNEDEYSKYRVDSDGTLLAYTGDYTSLSVPREIYGITVKAIGYGAFSQSNLVSINLPETVTYIDAYAFLLNLNLVSIRGAGVLEVSNCAFMGALKLNDIDMPNLEIASEASFGLTGVTELTDDRFPKLKYVDVDAFKYCLNLTSVNLTSVEYVGDGAFEGRLEEENFLLTSVDLPNAKYVGNNAFRYNFNLKEVNLENVEFLGDSALQHTSVEEITLPKVKYIGSSLFEGSEKLIKVQAPVVEEIGVNAFKNCNNLNSVEIAGVKTINTSAFENCSKLIDINLPNVENVGNKAFKGCGLVNLYLPKARIIDVSALENNERLIRVELNNVVDINKYAFANCKTLNSITLSRVIENIDSEAFTNTLPACKFYIYEDNVTSYRYVLKNNKIYSFISVLGTFSYEVSNDEIIITSFIDVNSEVILPNTINGLPVRKIADGAFENCTKIKTINLSNIKAIGKNAFKNSSIEYVNVINCESIDISAFENCINLNNIHIDKVKFIGDKAFYNTTSLDSIELGLNISNIGSYAIGYNTGNELSDIKIIGYSANYVVNNYIERFGLTDNFVEKVIDTYDGLRGGLVAISDNEYEAVITGADRNLFGEISLPRYVDVSGTTMEIVAVEAYAFAGCNLITKITLPESYKEIREGAFKNCLKLKEINVENILEIGTGAFENCLSLESVNLHKLLEIKERTFYNCNSLKNVNSNTVTTINAGAFENCYRLKTINFANLKRVLNCAFYNNFDLNLTKNNTINLLEVGDEAFANCKSLDIIYLSNLETMGNSVFSGSSVTKIIFGKNLAVIDENLANVENLVVYGYMGSSLESFAKDNKLGFVALDNLDGLQYTKNLRTKIILLKTDSDTYTLKVEINEPSFVVNYRWLMNTVSIDSANYAQVTGIEGNSFEISLQNEERFWIYVECVTVGDKVIKSNVCEVNIVSSSNEAYSTITLSYTTDDESDINLGGSAYIIQNENNPENSGLLSTITNGRDQEFSVTTSDGYRVKSVNVEGENILPNEIQEILHSIKRDGKFIITQIVADINVVIIFERDEFDIVFTIDGAGTVSNKGGEKIDKKITVKRGESKEIVISANSNYHIQDFVINNKSSLEDAIGNKSYIYKINYIDVLHYEEFYDKYQDYIRNDIYITISFSIDVYTITVSKIGFGRVEKNGKEVEGEVSVAYGANAKFDFVANEGFKVGDIMLDDVSKGNSKFYEIEEVTTDHTLHVTFVDRKYFITLSDSASEFGSIVCENGLEDIDYKDSRVVLIVPKAGYIIDESSVTVNGKPAKVTDNTITIHEINDDVVINVTFVEDEGFFSSKVLLIGGVVIVVMAFIGLFVSFATKKRRI